VGVAATNTELQTVVKTAVDKVTSGGVAQIVRAKWLGGLNQLSDSSQVSGIEVSAGTVEGAASDTAEVEGGTSGVQDGSTAGANAADIAG
jgi:polar amino acid transport system substrate-binding protein